VKTHLQLKINNNNNNNNNIHKRQPHLLVRGCYVRKDDYREDSVEKKKMFGSLIRHKCGHVDRASAVILVEDVQPY
jgi:hypothetical protein